MRLPKINLRKLALPKLGLSMITPERRKFILRLICGAATAVVSALTVLSVWDQLTKTEAHVEARSWIGLGAPRAVGLGGEPIDFELVSLGATVRNGGTETVKGFKAYVGTLAGDGAVHSQVTEQRVLAPKQSVETKLDLNGLASNGVMLCVAFDGGMGTSHWRLFFAYEDIFEMRQAAEGRTCPLQDVEPVCSEQMKALGPDLADWNRRYRR